MIRENWIDWAKAIGILLVVMGHSHYANENIISMIFMIHMPLFFFVSGYLFKMNTNLKELSIKNWKSLCIPYLLYNLIFAIFILSTRIIKLAIGGSVDWELSIFNPLWHTSLGVADGMFDGPTWFLLALIWCKYFTYILHSTKNMSLKISVLMVLGGGIVVNNILNMQVVLSIDCGIAGFLWFEIGYLMKLYAHKINIPDWMRCLFFPVGFSACYYLLQINGQCNYIDANVGGPLGIIATGMGLIAFFSACKLLGKIHSKVVTKISKASIVIMCLHMMIQGTLNKITHYQGGLLLTLVGDACIVFALTAIYPFFRDRIPALTGGR